MKKNSLSFIGLGLYDENDISLKGIEEIKKSPDYLEQLETQKKS